MNWNWLKNKLLAQNEWIDFGREPKNENFQGNKNN
jgi:hypothetical protein